MSQNVTYIDLPVETIQSKKLTIEKLTKYKSNCVFTLTFESFPISQGYSLPLVDIYCTIRALHSEVLTPFVVNTSAIGNNTPKKHIKTTLQPKLRKYNYRSAKVDVHSDWSISKLHLQRAHSLGAHSHSHNTLRASGTAKLGYLEGFSSKEK